MYLSICVFFLLLLGSARASGTVWNGEHHVYSRRLTTWKVHYCTQYQEPHYREDNRIHPPHIN